MKILEKVLKKKIFMLHILTLGPNSLLVLELVFILVKLPYRILDNKQFFQQKHLELS